MTDHAVTTVPDLGGSIGVTAGAPAFSFEDNRQYRCPVHGITTNSGTMGMYLGRAIDRTPNISVTVGPKEKQGYYCLLCYVDWVHATFPKLEEVKLPEIPKGK